MTKRVDTHLRRDSDTHFFAERTGMTKPRKKDGAVMFRARIKLEGAKGRIVANLFADTQDEMDDYIKRFNAIDITDVEDLD